MRTVIQYMKKVVTDLLDNAPLILISLEIITKKDEDKGLEESFVRAEVEVPKGYDTLSRCRFMVKIPNSALLLSADALEENDYEIIFQNLSISYIDNNGNVYFKADSYTVKPAD